ncbi:putative DNA-binding protein [Ktedonobacter racemifer DSM 44963]|uniref:Putative DNA-binding protein n=1 Tax=Ktedonobacter racemifer DSM 44963 TaxID=485913 RepID=D6TWB1_KTERA|nr:putative DNA-binding protein [Ktedonobacter racemifer DSM 44963]
MAWLPVHALFCTSTVQYIGEAWLTALLADLHEQNAEFRNWWLRYDIQGIHRERKEQDYPVVGQLILQSTSF